MVVGIGFRLRNPGCAPDDANLSFQLVPVEHESGHGIGRELGALPAAKVGKEDEPAGVHRLEQHDPDTRRPVCPYRRECHGVRFGDGGLDRLREPYGEHPEWIGGKVPFVEPGSRVFPA